MKASGVRNAVIGSLIRLSARLAAGFAVVARLGDYGTNAHLLAALGLGLGWRHFPRSVLRIGGGPMMLCLRSRSHGPRAQRPDDVA